MKNRRRMVWAQYAVRTMGGFLTIPTTSTLRAISRPGLRVVAATEIVKALRTLETLYQGVLEDAARELVEQGETWDQVAARSPLINPVELKKKVDADKRREYRAGWYRNYRNAA